MIVALLALAGTAGADKTPPAKKAPAKPDAKKADAKSAPKAADQPDDNGVADGSAADDQAPEEDPLMKLPHVEGPKLVDLGLQAEIDLPAGFLLWQGETAKEIVKKGGNSGENTVAVILPVDTALPWAVTVEYQDIGYVTDDDADKLDATELLTSYREGTTQQNLRRKEMGMPELFIDGWNEKPAYNQPKRQLTWCLDAHDTSGKVLNFITRPLGRNGFVSFDLIDGPETMAQSKVAIAPLLAGFRYKTGARYQDHKSEDKSSGFGLRALVLGGAGVAAVAKGGGFFIAILLAMKKAIIFVVAGIAGFFKWIFGKKKKNDFSIPPSDPPPGPPADPNV